MDVSLLIHQQVSQRFKAFYPASTNASDIKATVHVDPFTVFEAQHDETGTAAMNNSAFDFVGTSGSTITGQSTSEIDTSTSGTSGGFKTNRNLNRS